MPAVTEQDTQNENTPDEQLTSLCQYMELADPLNDIIKRSLLLMCICIISYVVLGFLIPDYTDRFTPLTDLLKIDYATFESWVKKYLLVSEELRWNRMLMLCYLSLYFGMWWTYFASKISHQEDVELKRLKIQTLRRMLGITATQWKPKLEISEDDKNTVTYLRDKSTASMTVIAILIAASILIFDQISNIWMSKEQFSLWQYSILWVGMLCTVISFICFMICVDSLDTIFNNFTSDPVRNVLIKYFYDYTINPRYVATAAMLLSIILLLGYHSEVLASLSIAIVLWVGYKFWFPDIQDCLDELKNCKNATRRKNYKWPITLLLLPIVVRAITYFLYA